MQGHPGAGAGELAVHARMRASVLLFNRVSAYPLIRRPRITPSLVSLCDRWSALVRVAAYTHEGGSHVSAFAFPTQEVRARRQDRRHRMFNSRYVRVSGSRKGERERGREKRKRRVAIDGTGWRVC